MNLYLIAHKVRGEAAFDVAMKIDIGGEEGWIIPTSGHRAYPYDSWHLDNYFDTDEIMIGMPEDCPDHYANESAPYGKVTVGPKLSLSDLGISKPKPTIQRRI